MNILMYLTYLLTPWNRVLLEKLTGFQLVKKFPAFYGTRIFITAKQWGVFLSKSQHNLVLLFFIQANDMFRPLF